jgi:D-alanine-D-alanine ligase-like ATP-grasp enzyme
MNKAIDNLKITNRLLAEEAESRGWKVEVFDSTHFSCQAVLRAEKDGKEFIYSSTLTTLTPACGYLIASDKYLTYGLLKSANISTPDFVMLPGDSNDFSEAEAFLKKHDRVVVKPTCTDHGDGVTIGVTTKDQLIKAITNAREAAKNSDSDAILIQEQVDGKEYRFLVVNGKCIAVANRRPAFVVGDGVKTVKALIEEKNQNPLRGDEHDKPLTKISLEEVAKINGEDFLNVIPENNQELNVLKTSNLSRGGEAVNCTDITAESLKALAESAATRCQLGIAGVDIITTDIKGDGKNYVIEVNSAPGIRMHVYPSVGKSINVTKYIIDVLERNARPVALAPRTIIGRSEYIESPLFGEGVKVPARTDTGARVASIWASDISMSEDGKLRFRLFDKQSEFYTGELQETDEYRISVVRNSTGQEEMRFRVKLPIVLAGKKISASFTLSDRSINSYPILIGRNVINNKFTVDVTQNKCQHSSEVTRKAVEEKNNKALDSNPYEFYKKYADKIVGVKK